MVITSDLDFSWHNNWEGFLDLTLSGNVHAEVDPIARTLSARISNLTKVINTPTTTGGGFINVGFVGWELPATETQGAYWEGSTGETYAGMIADFESKVPASTRSRIIYGYYSSDNAAHSPQGDLPYSNLSYSRALTDADFDANGNLKPISLVNVGSRWLENDTSSPNYGHAMFTYGMGVAVISGADLDWPYRPCAVKTGGTWKSCNRNGGDFRRMSNGTWATQTNDLYMDSKSHLMHRSGTFVRTPLIGE